MMYFTGQSDFFKIKRYPWHGRKHCWQWRCKGTFSSSSRIRFQSSANDLHPRRRTGLTKSCQHLKMNVFLASTSLQTSSFGWHLLAPTGAHKPNTKYHSYDISQVGHAFDWCTLSGRYQSYHSVLDGYPVSPKNLRQKSILTRTKPDMTHPERRWSLPRTLEGECSLCQPSSVCRRLQMQKRVKPEQTWEAVHHLVTKERRFQDCCQRIEN